MVYLLFEVTNVLKVAFYFGLIHVFIQGCNLDAVNSKTNTIVSDDEVKKRIALLGRRVSNQQICDDYFVAKDIFLKAHFSDGDAEFAWPPMCQQVLRHKFR
jgi:hypothetical protein